MKFSIRTCVHCLQPFLSRTNVVLIQLGKISEFVQHEECERSGWRERERKDGASLSLGILEKDGGTYSWWVSHDMTCS